MGVQLPRCSSHNELLQPLKDWPVTSGMQLNIFNVCDRVILLCRSSVVNLLTDIRGVDELIHELVLLLFSLGWFTIQPKPGVLVLIGWSYSGVMQPTPCHRVNIGTIVLSLCSPSCLLILHDCYRLKCECHLRNPVKPNNLFYSSIDRSKPNVCFSIYRIHVYLCLWT